MYQRVSWPKFPRSGTTYHRKHKERRLPLRVCRGWVSHFQNKSVITHFRVVFPKLTFLSFFLSSCHTLHYSSLVLHFHQSALGRSIHTSPHTLPLPSGREAPLPAHPAAALSGPFTLGPHRLFDPEPGGPTHTRTDQRCGLGPWGEGPLVPSG